MTKSSRASSLALLQSWLRRIRWAVCFALGADASGSPVGHWLAGIERAENENIHVLVAGRSAVWKQWGILRAECATSFWAIEVMKRLSRFSVVLASGGLR